MTDNDQMITSSAKKNLREALGFHRRALSCLLIGLAATALLGFFVSNEFDQKQELRFHHYREMVRNEIVRRVDTQVRTLHGMQGFFYGSEQVTREEWRQYIDNLEVDNFLGSLGYAFVRYVKRDELDRFLVETRADGAPGFQINSSGNLADLYVVEYIEPLTPNLAAVGYDIGQEIVRRQTAHLAVENNRAAMSGKISLVQDESSKAGFLLMLPVYHHGLPLDTPEQRWQALSGWVDTPILIDDLLRGVLDLNIPLDVMVFDGNPYDKENLLFDANNCLATAPNSREALEERFYSSQFSTQLTIEVAGRLWHLQLVALPSFTDQLQRNSLWLIVAAGVLLSVLSALLVRSLGGSLIRANEIAQSMTRDFLEVSKRYQSIVEHTTDLITRVDTSGRLLYVNPAALQIWGVSPAECIGRSAFDFIEPADRLTTQREFAEWLTKAEVADSSFSVENRQRHLSGKISHMRWTISPLCDSSGKVVELSGIAKDLSAVRREELLLEAQLRLGEFATDHSVVEILCRFLDEAELLTGSQIGFYHFVAADGETLQLTAWSTNTIEKMCKADGAGRHYPVDDAGVWVDCIREGRPVIHNDYAALPHKKGLPEGHAPVVRELVVPVYRGGQLLAVFGIGNKKDNYDEADLDLVQRLAESTWECVVRRQAEEALIQSERKYRQLFENMTVGFALHELICDEQGVPADYRFLDVNPAFEKLTGTPAAAVLGKTVKEVMPETEPYWIGTYGQVVASGEPRMFVNYARTLDKYFETWCFKTERNQFAVIFSDISNRKRNEQLLAASEVWHRTILQTAFSGIWTADLRGNILEVNDLYCQMTGYDRSELLKMNIADVEELETREAVAAQIAEISRSGEAHFESRHRRKDGSVFDVQVSVRYLTVDGGRCIAFIHDISEQKHAEQMLRRSHYALEKAQEIGSMGAWEFDIINNILFWTDENCRIFGVPEGSIVNYGVFIDKVHPDDREYVNREWQEAMKGKPYDIEHRLLIDGKTRWVREKAHIDFDDRGTALHAIGVTQNITDRKQFMEEYRRSEQLAALGTVAAGVAHEINNPIQGIINYATLISNAPEKTVRVADLSQRIIREGDRIAIIT